MTQEEFETRTLKAKQMLEKASGQKVIGYRAPSAYIAGWMLDSLEKIGFKYDSSVSINSFYNKSDSRLKGIDRGHTTRREEAWYREKKEGSWKFPGRIGNSGLNYPQPVARYSGFSVPDI